MPTLVVHAPPRRAERSARSVGALRLAVRMLARRPLFTALAASISTISSRSSSPGARVSRMFSVVRCPAGSRAGALDKSKP